MAARFILGALVLFTTSVLFAAHDEAYYSVHPSELQKVIMACPEKNPRGISCDALKRMALRINESAYQLRFDPQGYGKQILSLQEEIAQQEATISHAGSNESDLRASLNENLQKLQEHLAIVKWLESPSS